MDFMEGSSQKVTKGEGYGLSIKERRPGKLKMSRGDFNNNEG